MKKEFFTIHWFKLEISHTIFRTIKTGNWIEILWPKRSFNWIQKRSFELFENLLNKLKLDYVTILMNLRIIEKSKEENNFKINPNNKNQKCLLIINKGQKISRNDRCEATGKKFKNCCGAL